MAQLMINIEVTKGGNENNLSVLRRFQKRVQNAGILMKVREKRYTERTKSENVKRAKTLSYLKRKDEMAELMKLGKMNEVQKFGKKRR
jgi:ribosomal protein S21